MLEVFCSPSIGAVKKDSENATYALKDKMSYEECDKDAEYSRANQMSERERPSVDRLRKDYEPQGGGNDCYNSY